MASLLALAVVIAACGGGGSQGSEGTEEPLLITAEAAEFQFTPGAWQVPRGTDFTLTFSNVGVAPHTFTIVSLDETVTSSTELGPANVLFETEAQPGETVQASFTAPAVAGRYQVVCAVAGHIEAGMNSVLLVTES